jgi:two-component system phosphate regulon sensor histidine kinase PhoR
MRSEAQLPWIIKGHTVPERPHTLICVPIWVRDRLLGLLVALSYSTQEVSTYEQDLFSSIGRQIGISIQNMRLLEDASEIQILRELDRLRSELIANASHELRTPLGLIRIFATALLMDEVAFDPDTEHRFLTGIADETEKLEGIVDSLLDLSRMESGRMELAVESTDLSQLIRDAVAAMEPQLSGHQIICELPAEPLIAAVDRERLQQVVRNLLSNAIKYSPHGGTITVQGQQNAVDVSICVSDEGIGIRKQDQDKIFERFYRVDNDTTRRTRGVGLGLSICRWIVEAHRGRIDVESTPGKGSTFCIILPVREEDST